jgi:FkbM family methyltransferase
LDTSLEELRAEVASLREELAQWKRAALFRRQVDLIDFGSIRGFVYTDDLCYSQIDERFKHGETRQPLGIMPPKPFTIAEAYDREDIPLLELLFCHYWLNGLDFAHVDVGCQYGFGAMSAARRMRAYGKNNRVFAFDPGVAADLAPYNVAISNLLDQVTFERLAVSDAPRVATVFTELGHSENNRTVNRTLNQEAISYPVMATSLDEYARVKDVFEHLIVKIDTQGAEAEIFAGMQRLLNERCITVITEFTPWALASSVDAVEWLSTALQQFTAFDLPDIDPGTIRSHRAPRVPTHDVAGFVKQVDERPSRYADLLLLPKKLPELESLMARVDSSN